MTEDGGRTYVKMEGGVCGDILCAVDRDWFWGLESAEQEKVLMSVQWLRKGR
jgi:hypothetical protein